MAILPCPSSGAHDDAAPVTASEPWHGTSSGYGRHRCRCPQCRAHKAAVARAYAQKPIDPGKHGTSTNYRRGCRCDACRTWWNDQPRAAMARLRAEFGQGGAR